MRDIENNPTEHREYFNENGYTGFIPPSNTRRKKSPYLELFWSAFFPDFPAFGLNTERYFSISPYSVRMRENPEKMRTRILIICKIRLETQKIKKQLGKQSNLQINDRDYGFGEGESYSDVID